MVTLLVKYKPKMVVASFNNATLYERSSLGIFLRYLVKFTK